ncbi:MAG: hypothetical protein P4L87_15775 [Formivibrio sp.]|nr:hypothetical protein [Formivibrio sp.]
MKGDYTKPSDSKSQINTMNTDKNSYTATQSGTPAQPEQTVSDNTASKCLKDDLLAECHELVRLTQYDAKAGISFWPHVPSDCNDCGRCTNGARVIAEKFGGLVAGYQIEDTDPQTLVGADAGGHDFAIVGGFIVDWWGWQYEMALKTPVLTIADGIAQGKYKPQKDWKFAPLFVAQEPDNLQDCYECSKKPARKSCEKWLVRIVRSIQLEGDVEVEANDYWAAIAEAEKQPMSAVKQWKLMFDNSSADLDSGVVLTEDAQDPEDPKLAALLNELAGQKRTQAPAK